MQISHPMENHDNLEANPDKVEAAKQHTRKLSVTEAVSVACMGGFGDSFFQPFALFLNAGNQAMALIGTLPQAVGALAQIAGAGLSEKMGKRRPIIALCALMQALCYIPLFWIPFLFPSMGVPVVIVMITLCTSCFNLGGPPWLSMMSDVVPQNIRGSYFARRIRFWMAATIFSMVTSGILLWWFKTKSMAWAGFGILFILAALFRIHSAWLLNHHYDPPFNPKKEDYFSFWDFVKRTRHSNFAKFTFIAASINGITNIAGPFFSVYMIRDLHWNYIQFTFSTIAFLVGQFVFISWWGAMCDRHGNRTVLAAACLILPLIPLPWAFIRSFPALMCLQFISGSIWSGFNLAAGNFIMDACTPQKRPRATSYYTVVNSFFSLIAGSIIGAFLAENLPSSYNLGFIHISFLSSLPPIFIISGILRFIPVFFLPNLKEVRETEPITPIQLLWRFTTGEPIFSQIQQLTNLLAGQAKRANGNKNKKT